MASVNPLKVAAVAEFATGVYLDGALNRPEIGDDVSPEIQALSVAAEAIDGTSSCSEKASLGKRLEKMTRDYASILKRIDAIRIASERSMHVERPGLHAC